MCWSSSSRTNHARESWRKVCGFPLSESGDFPLSTSSPALERLGYIRVRHPQLDYLKYLSSAPSYMPCPSKITSLPQRNPWCPVHLKICFKTIYRAELRPARIGTRLVLDDGLHPGSLVPLQKCRAIPGWSCCKTGINRSPRRGCPSLRQDWAGSWHPRAQHVESVHAFCCGTVQIEALSRCDLFPAPAVSASSLPGRPSLGLG